MQKNLIRTPNLKIQGAKNFRSELLRLGHSHLFIKQSSLEKQLKNAPLNEGLVALHVCDAQGRILFSRNATAQRDWPEALLKDLQTGKSGLYESAEGLYVYQALSTAQWRLIAQIDFKTLLSQKGAP